MSFLLYMRQGRVNTNECINIIEYGSREILKDRNKQLHLQGEMNIVENEEKLFVFVVDNFSPVYFIYLMLLLLILFFCLVSVPPAYFVNHLLVTEDSA